MFRTPDLCTARPTCLTTRPRLYVLKREVLAKSLGGAVGVMIHPCISGVFIRIYICCFLYTYRYRFDIQLFLYYAKSRQLRLLMGRDNRQLVDGFIVYGREDLRWIIDNFLPEMEEKRHFEFVIEDRDWAGGVARVDHIMESFEQSRKVIIIISEYFTTDPWCNEALEMAQSFLAGKFRNVLIPIILQEPPVEQMTAALRHIMTMNICLYWPRHQRNEKVFWKSLTAALKKRTRGTELEAGDQVEV